MNLRIALLVGAGFPAALAAQAPGAQDAPAPSAVAVAFVDSLSTHPGVDVEIARFEDGRLEEDYRRAFAAAARARVTADVGALLDRMISEGCSPDVTVEFPGERFSDLPDPSSTEKDFEDSLVLTRSTACYETSATPDELLRVYSSREVRMAAQSRMEDVYEEDGLLCYAVGGVPLLVGATRSCNEVRGWTSDSLALDHSQTVWSQEEDHQPVFFKESLKAAVRLDDGRTGLVHVTLTRSTGLGGLEKRLGRGKIEDSLRRQTEVLAEHLTTPAGPGHP